MFVSFRRSLFYNSMIEMTIAQTGTGSSWLKGYAGYMLCLYIYRERNNGNETFLLEYKYFF